MERLRASNPRLSKLFAGLLFASTLIHPERADAYPIDKGETAMVLCLDSRKQTIIHILGPNIIEINGMHMNFQNLKGIDRTYLYIGNPDSNKSVFINQGEFFALPQRIDPIEDLERFAGERGVFRPLFEGLRYRPSVTARFFPRTITYTFQQLLSFCYR